MNFATIEFLVFFTATAAVYYGVPSSSWNIRKLVLLAASFAFYASWSAPFTLLLLYSILLDYNVGRLLPGASKRNRPLLLALSLLGNLGVLTFFKYGGFIYDSSLAVSLFAQSPALSSFFADLILPLGISFYTFQSMSYAIDVYRGDREPARDFVEFALYVSFFPQLIAGPIMRAGELLPQLQSAPTFRTQHFQTGFARFGIGLTKKVVCADLLALFADPVFAAPSEHSPISVALALYAYAFQIYFDFSGYTDMAIGLARMLGFDLVENFNFPYLASTITDFWRRWHMTLSRWLRDYLYVPLGGSRSTKRQTYRNLMITMLLGGLWHGAGWNFVLWGGLHGFLLAVERALGWREPPPATSARAVRIFVTFHLVLIGWFFFRIQSSSIAYDYLKALQGPWLQPTADESGMIVLVFLAYGLHYADSALGLRQRFEHSSPLVQGLAVGAAIILMLNLRGLHQAFIYFQF